jgi:dipeptidyl aminopeptidase/acylaminoacyl peptidase
MPVAGGPIKKLTQGRQVIDDYSARSGGSFAILRETAVSPAEIAVLENGAQRTISNHNQWIGEVSLGRVEDVSSRSKDGTEVHGLLTKPASHKDGQRLPMVLWIHGGPNMQDEHSFRFERHIFAASGYAVLTVNYRGSSGRGSAHQKAIFGDWGNLEVQDLLGAVEEAVRSGVADPDALGIGGWSYGGILTNYTIASDTRFRAAVSGASSSLQLSMYGTDQYAMQYEREVGHPWDAKDTWLKLSYPFFQADKIKTPTLFLGCTKDFNVPIAGVEQMYLALKSLGVPSRLVVYPDQHHIPGLPSYQRDCYERYIAWYDKYLKVAK